MIGICGTSGLSLKKKKIFATFYACFTGMYNVHHIADYVVMCKTERLTMLDIHFAKILATKSGLVLCSDAPTMYSVILLLHGH